MRGVDGVRYVYFKDIIFDANNAVDSSAVANIRDSIVENGEIRNAGQNGLIGTARVQYLNVDIHHNGFNSTINPAINCNVVECGYGIYTSSIGGDLDGNQWIGG